MPWWVLGGLLLMGCPPPRDCWELGGSREVTLEVVGLLDAGMRASSDAGVSCTEVAPQVAVGDQFKLILKRDSKAGCDRASCTGLLAEQAKPELVGVYPEVSFDSDREACTAPSTRVSVGGCELVRDAWLDLGDLSPNESWRGKQTFTLSVGLRSFTDPQLTCLHPELTFPVAAYEGGVSYRCSDQYTLRAIEETR